VARWWFGGGLVVIRGCFVMVRGSDASLVVVRRFDKEILKLRK
jgi:hypothetical protein